MTRAWKSCRADRNRDASCYPSIVSFLRWLLPLAVAATTLSCSQAAPTPVAPSSRAERTPSPGTVTGNNPAGDARAKEDAALTRLTYRKAQTKHDRFGTLDVPLPDGYKWRRIWVWGNPMRAAFRYGKKHYAVAVLEYRDTAEDEPTKCLENYVARMKVKAAVFDMELTPIERSMGKRWRGVESIDWAKRDAERRKKLAARKKRYAELRRRLKQRRRQLRARQRRLRRSLARIRLKRSRARRPTRKPPANLAERVARLQAKLRDLKARLFAPTRWRAKPKKRKKRLSQQALRKVFQLKRGKVVVTFRRKGQKRRHRRRAVSKPLNGYGSMPIVRTSGQFTNLFDRDRYIGAIVAHRSWPGSCLVYGFAVRVGTDEKLATRVVERWVRDFAPKLQWKRKLRKKPPIKNR